MLLLTTARTALAHAIAPASAVAFSQSGGQIAAAITQAIGDGTVSGVSATTRRILEAR